MTIDITWTQTDTMAIEVLTTIATIQVHQIIAVMDMTIMTLNIIIKWEDLLIVMVDTMMVSREVC